MKICRRTLILSGITVAALVTIPPFYIRARRHFAQVLADFFPAHIAEHPEAQLFLDSFTERWVAQTHPKYLAAPYLWFVGEILPGRHDLGVPGTARMLAAFVKETTVVRLEETGKDLTFTGPPDRMENPCANPLSAAWL